MAKKKKKLLKCADCGAEGIRLIHRGKIWVCEKCDRNPRLRDTATNPFQFDSMHIGSDPSKGPIQVTGLNHLRRLEKEHGVISVMANYDRQDIPLRGGKEQFHDRGNR